MAVSDGLFVHLSFNNQTIRQIITVSNKMVQSYLGTDRNCLILNIYHSLISASFLSTLHNMCE